MTPQFAAVKTEADIKSHFQKEVEQNVKKCYLNRLSPDCHFFQ